MCERLVIGPSSLVDSFPVPCNFLLAPLLQSPPHFTTDRLEPSSFQRTLFVGLGGGILLDPSVCNCFGGGGGGGSGGRRGGSFIITNISLLIKCGKKMLARFTKTVIMEEICRSLSVT
jgi:hypothetical protein